MLKFIFYFVSLCFFVNSWNMIQVGLFISSFIMSLLCMHDFYMYMSGFSMGMDYLSYILILLSIWIMSLIVCASMKIKISFNFKGMFLFVNLTLLIFLIISFSTLDYLMFYISFEAALIPTMLLILGWGYQPERIQAGVYMLFYTLFGSLPLLISLLYIYMKSGSLMMESVYLINNMSFLSMLWFFSTMFAFVVKLPMYLMHIWLPKAHVEAPVAGSMILAGVLLKLGGYGLIRVLPMFSSINKMFCSMWVSLGMIGGFMISLICLRQVDMKALIAYSSVAHMGMVLAGLIMFSWWGLNGSVVMMVGHGLCSSGMFCLANIVYERTGSRSLYINKGLMNFMPNLALWWFLLSISNMAAPPTINLLGEINLIMSMVAWSKFMMISICFLSFFSASYTLYLYSLSQHGLYFNSMYSCCSGKVREYLVLSLHWIPLNILILKCVLLSPNL
uniref:NADH-ubiquinone oxidoreductase chain 4 n=1 Tax=Pylocheles mortensenii TaxID=941203 RepID=A0A3S6J4N2_9EUCA|nr:NADH dehydrogenase subunit 4 [Pylocheles mortensenii]